ncbi:hypothetical protein JRT83AECX_JRT83AEC_04904 [Escherichia coli]|nr:phage protein NinX family protein [Escherichia coli]CAJ1307496.1 hypothetical protein JRT83AECX_JRT83AEC_04904 [Escherichia coli]
MDYSQLSDFEINKRVFKAIVGAIPLGYPHNADGRSVGNESNGNYRWYDYCNNPEDAWPIITENKISIMFDSTDMRYEGEYHEWCDAISSCQKFGIQHQSNPLRAAMIVFLMMQDANNA